MSANLFQELRERKEKLLSFTHKAKEYGWIDAVREKEICDKINTDVLTIGVIGQIKCGKSTVLNAIVFEDDVLPSATTPMTAALTVITYGEKKKLKAEFYTSDEWAEQKMQAARSLEEVANDSLEESKVKAAKELVEKSVRLGSSINSLLGTTKEDNLEQLAEYVGADGKYVSITKSVTIYYPKDYLKGVEIVDTPGFNDPIVSREERTKSFLQKADVVLLMLYVGRPFDSTDRDILFKNVRQCGIGKVLIGINKYDIAYHNGEPEAVIQEYVKDEIRKACQECDDTTLVEILKETDPIPLSAEMALLSELPMTKVINSEIYNSAWQRYCDDFEISSQSQMKEKSHLENLMDAVKQVIEKEKLEILLRKPFSAILNAGNKKKTDIEKQIKECDFLIKNLSSPEEEIEEKIANLSKANRRLNKKIDFLGDDIENALKNETRRGENLLEDTIDSSCNQMDKTIEDLGLFQGGNSIAYKLEAKISQLNRALKQQSQEIADKAKRQIKTCIEGFIDEANDVLLKYVPDYNAYDILKSIENEVIFDLDNDNSFVKDWNTDFQRYDWGNIVGNLLDHGTIKSGLHQEVKKIRQTNVKSYVESILESKNNILENVKEKVIEETIQPLKTQLDDFLEHKGNRENQLKEASERLNVLKSHLEVIKKQLSKFS